MTQPVDPYELRAALHRIAAVRLRVAAAEHDLAAKSVMATRSMRRFAAATNQSVAQEVAHHPDLAELNVQLDGYYGERSRPQDTATHWCKCPSCWGWFVEDHPGEDLDELGRDLSWWAGLPEHREPPQ